MFIANNYHARLALTYKKQSELALDSAEWGKGNAVRLTVMLFP